MYHLKFILLIGLTIFSCQNAKQKYLEAGSYRGLINVANDKALAFNFMVTDSTHLEVYNANEVQDIPYNPHRWGEEAETCCVQNFLPVVSCLFWSFPLSPV